MFLFNSSGEFKNKIGTLGRGPSEYAGIEEFILIPDKDLVAVYSARQLKTLTYNLEGKFVNSFKTDFWPLGLSYFNENLIFFNTIGRRKMTDYYALSVFSLRGKLLERLHYKPEEKEFEKDKTLEVKTGRLGYFVLNDTLRFKEGDYGKDIVWSLTKENKVVPKNSIYFDDQLWKIDFYIDSKKMDFSETIKYSVIEHYLESSSFQFIKLYYSKHKKGYNVYHDKKKKSSKLVRYKREVGKGVHSKFYNNIDGGFPFWPQGKVSDDKMYMLIYGYELKDFLARKKKNPNILDKVGREKLLKLADNSKISDNPILMIVTLKK